MKRQFKFLILMALSFLFTFLISSGNLEALTYKVIPVKNGGTIKGKVTFLGKPPAPERIPIKKNREFCGEGFREVSWVRVNKGRLTEAIVYLDDIEEGKAWPSLKEEVTHLDDPDGKDFDLVYEGKYLIDQRDCRFHPWIRVYRNGADIIVRSSDPVAHNMHFRELVGKVKKTIFNVSQRNKGDILKKVRAKRSKFLRINCEPHNFMFSWGLAADNPYAVELNRDGTYEIADIPAGTYKLIVWHPILGLKKANVKVLARGSIMKDFQYLERKIYKRSIIEYK